MPGEKGIMTRVILVVTAVCALSAAVRADSGDSASAEDFEPLFNGVNLVGWLATSGHARDWSVEDGEIVVSGRSPDGARKLRTATKYESFELRLEFMVAEGGNSGVFFRMGEEDLGLEIQLLDDSAAKHRDLKDWQYSGSLYGMAAPARRVSRSSGEWQDMIVHLKGQELSIALNGSWIVETNLDEHLSSEEASDWHEPLRRTSGYLGLQNYGTETRFRNIGIRRLDTPY